MEEQFPAEIDKITNEIVMIANLEKQETKKLKELENKKPELHKQLEYVGTLTSKKQTLKNKLDLLLKKSASEKNQLARKKSLLEEVDYMMKKPGENIVNVFAFKRLEKELIKSGYQGQTLNGLINEIIFEIRFGSLQFGNKTKEKLDPHHAISIALKLVREGRWTTPAPLLKKTDAM